MQVDALGSGGLSKNMKTCEPCPGEWGGCSGGWQAAGGTPKPSRAEGSEACPTASSSRAPPCTCECVQRSAPCMSQT